MSSLERSILGITVVQFVNYMMKIVSVALLLLLRHLNTLKSFQCPF